jgi:alkylhydroperoxidase/carboxymuconolactone decarboxylase family protein YurZ/quinol monooxygenase YgiN
MNTNLLKKWLHLTILILSINKMDAQTNSATTYELSLQEQSVVIISALTATGDLGSLKKQLNAGLDAGLKINEITPGFGEFAPRIDAFLKEHLFADVFESDVLTYKQRELVTISALAAMTGVGPQLQSHVGIGKNTGITDDELVQVSDLIEKYISRTQANTLRVILSRPASPVIEPDMMVRISEIEILPQYLDEYNAILKEEAAASVEKEPGVITIFPMYKKDAPTEIRIVEIYQNKSSNQSHLKTPHFQHYKTTTLKMVKSLKLIDMTSIDVVTMQDLFKKIK